MPAVCRQATRGEEDPQDAGGEGVRSWNLRRCSATGLDVLSTVFGDSLLALVVPVVQQRLQVGGAVSRGMQQQLPGSPTSRRPLCEAAPPAGVALHRSCPQVMSGAHLALQLPGRGTASHLQVEQR